jgi:hypothetical protein
MNESLDVLRLRNKVVNRNLEVKTKFQKKTNICIMETVCKLSKAENTSNNISSSVNIS